MSNGFEEWWAREFNSDEALGFNLRIKYIARVVWKAAKATLPTAAGANNKDCRKCLNDIVQECAKPLETYSGGYSQKNAKIQLMAEKYLSAGADKDEGYGI